MAADGFPGESATSLLQGGAVPGEWRDRLPKAGVFPDFPIVKGPGNREDEQNRPQA